MYKQHTEIIKLCSGRLPTSHSNIYLDWITYLTNFHELITNYKHCSIPDDIEGYLRFRENSFIQQFEAEADGLEDGTHDVSPGCVGRHTQHCGAGLVIIDGRLRQTLNHM